MNQNGSVLHEASLVAGNTYTISESLLIPNKVHIIRIWSVRDSRKSYQSFEHSFTYSTEIKVASNMRALYLSDVLVKASSISKTYDINDVDKASNLNLEFINE